MRTTELFGATGELPQAIELSVLAHEDEATKFITNLKRFTATLETEVAKIHLIIEDEIAVPASVQ